MAITFPVGLRTYFAEVGELRPMRRRLHISDNRSYAESYGGESYVSSYGTSLWQGLVEVTPLHTALMRPLEARVRALQRADAVFFIGDLMDDPAPPNAGAPQIAGVAGNGQLNLSGMTPGYRMPIGLKLSFGYGTRFAYHEIIDDGVVSSNGTVGVEVYPPVEPGWTAGTAVQLGNQAVCAAIMLPKTLSESDAGPNISQGFSFAWRQTLRT